MNINTLQQTINHKIDKISDHINSLKKDLYDSYELKLNQIQDMSNKIDNLNSVEKIYVLNNSLNELNKINYELPQNIHTISSPQQYIIYNNAESDDIDADNLNIIDNNTYNTTSTLSINVQNSENIEPRTLSQTSSSTIYKTSSPAILETSPEIPSPPAVPETTPKIPAPPPPAPPAPPGSKSLPSGVSGIKKKITIITLNKGSKQKSEEVLKPVIISIVAVNMVLKFKNYQKEKKIVSIDNIFQEVKSNPSYVDDPKMNEQSFNEKTYQLNKIIMDDNKITETYSDNKYTYQTKNNDKLIITYPIANLVEWFKKEKLKPFIESEHKDKIIDLVKYVIFFQKFKDKLNSSEEAIIKLIENSHSYKIQEILSSSKLYNLKKVYEEYVIEPNELNKFKIIKPFIYDFIIDTVKNINGNVNTLYNDVNRELLRSNEIRYKDESNTSQVFMYQDYDDKNKITQFMDELKRASNIIINSLTNDLEQDELFSIKQYCINIIHHSKITLNDKNSDEKFKNEIIKQVNLFMQYETDEKKETKFRDFITNITKDELNDVEKNNKRNWIYYR